MEKSFSHKKSHLYYFFKRSFDIVSSLLLLLLLLWLMVLISFIVLITSGYPFVYKDKRVGKNGKVIYVLKYRTMVRHAEERIKELLSPEQYELWKKEHKIENDPRITKIGKFLRKSSLDELPQLFNILFGSMSVVGPRPITAEELDKYFSDDERKILLSTRPGLISYWSLCGRSDVCFADGKRQELELEYFKYRGLLFDLKIIFKIIPHVLIGKGAK